MRSSLEGYTYFKQKYSPDNSIYEVVLLDGSTGYTIENGTQSKEALPNETIQFIKGHEFHKMQMFPDLFFDALKYQEETFFQNKKYEKFIGIDHLSNQVSLFYNRHKHRVEGAIIMNPYDTSEKIEIFYKDWMDSSFGEIAKSVDIIQGGKDLYHFEFEEVKFNVSDRLFYR